MSEEIVNRLYQLEEEESLIEEERQELYERWISLLPVEIGDKVIIKGYSYSGRTMFVTDLSIRYELFGEYYKLVIRGNVMKKGKEGLDISKQNTSFEVRISDSRDGRNPAMFSRHHINELEKVL